MKRLMCVHELGVLVRNIAETTVDPNGLASGLISLGSQRVPFAQQMLVLRVMCPLACPLEPPFPTVLTSPVSMGSP